MIIRDKDSKIIENDSSNDGHAVNNGGGLFVAVAASASSGQDNRRRRLLLLVRRIVKIGLAISIGYQITWATKQLFNLTTVVVVTRDAEDLNDIPKVNKLLSKQERIIGNERSGGYQVGHEYSHQIIAAPHQSSSSFANAQLQALVQHNQTTAAINSCPKGLHYVSDHMALTPEENNRRRLIPNVLHFTTKTRCMTSAFAANIQLWKNRLGSQYSIYIHDDDAVDKFIYQREWREFPELKEVMACITAGAAKADIWRYLMIWEYGGIYSDIDCSPGSKLNVYSIDTNDDAYFPLEALGIPSQYFFAASPRHPVMFLSAKHALQGLSFQEYIAHNNAAKTTGPGAFKAGFILFQQLAGIPTNGYVTEGVYQGVHGRSVRVIGSKEFPREYVMREGVKRKDKMRDYAQMGMTHFQHTREVYKERTNDYKLGCLEVRYKMHVDGTADWVNIV